MRCNGILVSGVPGGQGCWETESKIGVCVNVTMDTAKNCVLKKHELIIDHLYNDIFNA